MLNPLRAALGPVLALLVFASATLAHEGHSHDEPGPPAIHAAAPRGAGQSALFEVVAIAKSGEIVVYLDRFATNEPVADATVEFETPQGPVVAEPRPDGTYRLAAPWLKQDGATDLIVTITAGADLDIVPLSIGAGPVASTMTAQTSAIPSVRELLYLAGGVLGGLALASLIGRLNGRPHIAALLLGICATLLGATGLSAHEGHDHGAPVAAGTLTGDVAKRQPDGAVFVPKPTQRIFGVLTFVTTSAAHRDVVELPGRIIPDPDASGYVQSAVGGRLSAPPGGFPRLGTRVKAGDVLAYVTPPLQAIDVSDMRQRQGELDQQIAITERKLARSAPLALSGSLAKAPYEDTLSELEGLRQRRAFLEASRREVEALVAPVDGVIADGAPVAGQIANPNAVVFQIADPQRLWVEALSFEAVVGNSSASARAAGGAHYVLSPRGTGFSDRNQSVPLHFAIEGNVSGLRAGQLLSVFVETTTSRNGIAVPRSSIVRAANGQDIVYVHTQPELFEPRQVRTAPLDAGRVLVTAGLAAGQRVVVQAAELLDQIR